MSRIVLLDAGPLGVPRLTSQKLRMPPYWPDFALRRLQGTPPYGATDVPEVNLKSI